MKTLKQKLNPVKSGTSPHNVYIHTPSIYLQGRLLSSSSNSLISICTYFSFSRVFSKIIKKRTKAIPRAISITNSNTTTNTTTTTKLKLDSSLTQVRLKFKLKTKKEIK